MRHLFAVSLYFSTVTLRHSNSSGLISRDGRDDAGSSASPLGKQRGEKRFSAPGRHVVWMGKLCIRAAASLITPLTFATVCGKSRIIAGAAVVEPFQGKNINLVRKLIELRSLSQDPLLDVCRDDAALFNSQGGQPVANVIVRHQFRSLSFNFAISFVCRLLCRSGSEETNNERVDCLLRFLIKSGWVQLIQLISKLVCSPQRDSAFFCVPFHVILLKMPLYWL